jgi:hypothetical protein
LPALLACEVRVVKGVEQRSVSRRYYQQMMSQFRYVALVFDPTILLCTRNCSPSPQCRALAEPSLGRPRPIPKVRGDLEALQVLHAHNVYDGTRKRGYRHRVRKPVTGGFVRVGCAPGVDAAVRSCCLSAIVLRASSLRFSPRSSRCSHPCGDRWLFCPLRITTHRRFLRSWLLPRRPRSSPVRAAHLVRGLPTFRVRVLVALAPGGRARIRLLSHSLIVLTSCRA